MPVTKTLGLTATEEAKTLNRWELQVAPDLKKPRPVEGKMWPRGDQK